MKTRLNKPFKNSVGQQKPKGRGKDLFRRNKRFKRKLKSKEKRKLLNRIKTFKKSRKYIGLLDKKRIPPYFKSRITYEKNIEIFCKSNKNKYLNEVHGTITLSEEFCIYKNPNYVLSTLLKILNNAKINNFTRVEYNGDISFGALYLLDAVCWEIASKHPKWRLNAKNISKRDYEIQTNLKSFQTGDSKTEEAFIYNNRIEINRVNDKLAKQRHKEASKTVTELINRGIESIIGKGNDLSYSENAAIISAITEHFDNILLHVPNARYGYLCTFFDRRDQKVTILIFNYGHTIASTLEKNDIPNEVKTDIELVIQNHKKMGYLGFGNSFTKENALTLLALQEGISSKLIIDDSRGHGLIDYINHCKKLNNGAKITIISGKTAIRIDETSNIREQNVFGRSRKIIAFNNENDLYIKPDKKHVIKLNVFFPGVIIETVIPLKRKNE